MAPVPHPSPARTRGARSVLLLALLAAALGLGATARAQVSSEGKGTITVEVGRGSGPFGDIAEQTADPSADVSHATVHPTAFRLLAGYHFAEQLSVDFGLVDLGSFSSSVPYAAGDTLTASTTLAIVEADLVARIPVASNVRFDITGGFAESGFNTSISTHNGSALPSGSESSAYVRRFGLTTGLDAEWRFSDVTSFILGYHLYTHVGSSRLAESASGTANGLFAGLHFEF
jgi:hypothetical protein